MQASLIKQVEKHFHEAFLQAKTQFDKKVAIREFPLGCKVFVYTTQRGQFSKKLHKPYKGPFTCIGHSQNNNLILRQPQSSKLLHVHVAARNKVEATRWVGWQNDSGFISPPTNGGKWRRRKIYNKQQAGPDQIQSDPDDRYTSSWRGQKKHWKPFSGEWRVAMAPFLRLTHS